MNPVLSIADVTAYQAGLLAAWLALAGFVWWLARAASRVKRRNP